MRAGDRRLTLVERVIYALVLFAWFAAALIFDRESLQGAGREVRQVVTAVESQVQHAKQTWRENFR